MSSGDANYSTPASNVEDAINGYLDMLSRYVAQHGYPAPPASILDGLLELTGEDLLKLTSDELAALEFDAAKIVFSVGDEYNRQQTIVERCRTKLARLVGNKLPGDVYNRDDKWMTAARGDPTAWAYWLKLQNARTAAIRLEGQAMRLNELVKAISNLIYSRR